MSIFDVEERRLIDAETQQSEIDASNEYQKELDEVKQIVCKDKQNICKSKQSASKVKVRNGRRKQNLLS